VDAAPPVWIVLVNWNGADDTLDCLHSLGRLDYQPRHVVVVDNGSTDDSVARLQAPWPNLDLLLSQTNLGFAGGNNLGIRYALNGGAAYIWILNNDTTVDPSSLSELIAVAEQQPDVGIVGSIQYEAGAGDVVQSWGGGNFSRLTRNPSEATFPGPRDYITAASMLVRRRVFEEIGLFDERFFIYWEDADLSRRATEHGWRLAVAPRAVVYHKLGAAMNTGVVGRSLRSDRVHVESSGIFVSKHSGRLLPLLASIRLTGIVVNRVKRRQFRRIPQLVGDFAHGLRVGRQPVGMAGRTSPSAGDTQ
jgi:GT2 family glycosyltransferase